MIVDDQAGRKAMFHFPCPATRGMTRHRWHAPFGACQPLLAGRWIVVLVCDGSGNDGC
jgi:hypothetical protein